MIRKVPISSLGNANSLIFAKLVDVQNGIACTCIGYEDATDNFGLETDLDAKSNLNN